MLQRRYATIGTAIAERLYKKYNLKDFSGYVFTRESFEFVKNHVSPRFDNLLLDEDVHRLYESEKIDWEYLKKLEAEYGLPNLWPYIELDRTIRSSQLIRAYPYDTPAYSHEEMARIMQATAKAIIKFLDEAKPDAIVFSAIGAISSLLLYHIAKKRNIKILHIHPTRVNDLCTLSGDFAYFDDVNGLFDYLISGKISLPEETQSAQIFLDKFRQKPEPYCALDLPKYRPIDRRRQFNFLKPKNFIWSLYWRAKRIILYLKNPYRDDYSTMNPFWEIWDNTKKKVRVLIGYERFYDKIDFNENYAFFPLHLEPEIALLLHAPFYKDQLWLIKQIARSLPLDFKLYVKEHPAMVGYRPRRFYRELKKIPSVKIIRPSLEGLPLVKNSKLVVTVSGTSGWEAILLKKPVIIFGDVFFGKLPGVKKCLAINELPYLVNEQLKNFKHDEDALIKFLSAIFAKSAQANFVQIWKIDGADSVSQKKDGLMPLADLIAKKLGL